MPDPLGSVVLRFKSSGLAGMPSNSTGASLIAGVAVSMRGVWLATAGEVLWGKVPLRETGEMGPSEEAGAPEVVMEGGETGTAVVIVAIQIVSCWTSVCVCLLEIIRKTSERVGTNLRKTK